MRTRRPTRIGLPEKEIIEAYNKGTSKDSLAKRFRVAERVIKDILLDHGIQLRTQSQANKLRWDRITPKEVRARSLKHAITVQYLAKMTPLEKSFSDAFQKAGIDVVPLYALDVFNLDFAIPKIKLAIEIDNNWHDVEANQIKDRRKEAYLEKEGWTLIRFRQPVKREIEFDKVIKIVMSHMSVTSLPEVL